MRFQPPGRGRSPSGIARPAELAGPLSNSRNDPRLTSANAGAALERSEKPRCFVYQSIAASTSSTMYRTLTVASDISASRCWDKQAARSHGKACSIDFGSAPRRCHGAPDALRESWKGFARPAEVHEIGSYSELS